MKLKLIVFVLLATCGAARAEFTIQEKTEVVKLIQAQHLDKRGAQRVADYIAATNDSSPDVTGIVHAGLGKWPGRLEPLLYFADCEPGGCRPNQIGPRDLAIAKAIEYVNEHKSGNTGKLDALITACTNTSCWMLEDARKKFKEAAALTASFDTSLEYLEPRDANNLAMPGATRLVSSAALPHGDYLIHLDQIEHSHRYAGHACRRGVEAYRLHPTQNLATAVMKVCEMTGNIQMIYAEDIGLMMGVELPSRAADIDTQILNSSTARPRVFWTVNDSLALLSNTVERLDVFGVTIPEGTPEPLETMCKTYRSAIQNDPDTPPWLFELAMAFSEICDAWRTNDMAFWELIAFDHFTNIGKPPDRPAGEVTCDPNSTELVTATNMCVGLSAVTCGLGTFQSNAACLPDPCPTCPPVGSPPGDEVVLMVSVDNVDEVYLNGVLLGSSDDWQQASSFMVGVQPGISVVAVKGIDAGGVAGLIAELAWQGNMAVSDSTWKVSTVNEVGWQGVGFDDSAWIPATSYGAYGVGPWKTRVSGLPSASTAEWIWSADNDGDDTVYFRYSLTVN